MSLKAQIVKAVNEIPECLAGGFVDISTGMLLDVKTVDSHPDEVLQLVAAATADLFAGKNVSMIEAFFKKSRGLEADDYHYFQEIIVNSDNWIEAALGRLRQREQRVLVRAPEAQRVAAVHPRDARVVECGPLCQRVQFAANLHMGVENSDRPIQSE